MNNMSIFRLQRNTCYTLIALFAFALLVISLTLTAQAAPNYEINYQGKLTASTSATVADGTYQMEFNLYTQPSGGSPIWTETLSGANEVSVTNGLFSVMLGSTSPLTSVNFNQTLYLGVTIEGDSEMSPRKVLGTVPAAFEAKNANTVGGVASTSFLRSDQADTATSLLTFTGGIIVNSASSTITRLSTLTATTTNLVVNGERFTDLTGTGLINTGNALTVNTAYLNTLYASTSAFNTCSELAAILSGNTTGTCGSFVLSASPTFTGTIQAAAATLSSTLTLSGTAANIALGSNYLSGDGGDEGVFVDGSGNVGIGTSTPNQKMTVDGAINISNSAYGYMLHNQRLLYASSTSGLLVGGLGAGSSLRSTTTADVGNTIFGHQALSSATSSRYITAIGYRALASNSWSPIDGYDIGGDANTAVGYEALTSNTIGHSNVALGAGALAQNTRGDFNTALGTWALSANTIGEGNVAIGLYTLAANNGDNNTGIGREVLSSNTTGVDNVGIGIWALSANRTGNYNVAIGRLALGETTSSSRSIAIGYEASANNQNATDTVAVGYQAGRGTGDFTATGYTLLGKDAGRLITTGADYNTLIGFQSGEGITTGSRNIFLGPSTLSASQNQVTTGSRNISIGNDVAVASTTANNQLTIGNLIYGRNLDGTGSTISTGNIGIGTSTPSQRLSIAGSLRLTGALYDSLNSAGSNGYVLQSTATGQRWVATSTLGFTSNTSFDTSAELAAIVGDETGSGRLVFSNAPAFSGTATFSSLTATGTATFATTTQSGRLTLSGAAANIALGSNWLSGDGGDEGVFVDGSGNVGIGTTTPSRLLDVNGNIGINSDGIISELNALYVTGNRAMFGYDGVNNNAVVQGSTAKGIEFNVNSAAFGSGTVMVINSSGNIGMGTTTPAQKLSVVGNLRLTGALYDSVNSAGSNGMVLQSTATGQRWVATSTLGLGGGSLTGSGSANRVAYWSGASALTSDATFTFANSKLTVPVFNTTNASTTVLSISNSPFIVASTTRSTFALGVGARLNATSTPYGSIFLGTNAGWNATNASYATFMGENAGFNAVGATYANFMGYEAGNGATNAVSSNFIGDYAGFAATNADFSQFIGSAAGQDATNAQFSQFIGSAAGQNATNAEYSNFMGYNAGYSADNASNAIFLGSFAGYNDTVTNTGSNSSIAIGRYSGTGGFSNSISLGRGVINSSSTQLNIGNLLYGSLIYNSDTQTATPVSNGRIGIGTSTPSQRLTVAGNLRLTGALYDSTNSAGTNGMVLQSTATGQRWVATSTLGFGSGSVTGSGSANRVAYWSGASALTSDSTFTFANSKLTVPVFNTTNASTTVLSISNTPLLVASTSRNILALGYGAKINATSSADNAFFVGLNAGRNAIETDNSTFIGNSAGQNAQNASESNFFGASAGNRATNAYNSNFIGSGAGDQATNANDSNFFGSAAGASAVSANYSNFFGNGAGYGATTANNSNFFGQSAGRDAFAANRSNFIGYQAGYQASTSAYSNFFGSNAGLQAYEASDSNFFGSEAGSGAIEASYSNFIGPSAGYGATNAYESNFFGGYAGYLATSSYDSNFFGYAAGESAFYAANSNFLGSHAGNYATNAYFSNFLGNNAGRQATNANNSVFIGYFPGYSAANASEAIFLGTETGYNADNAANALFLGYRAGYNDTVNNTSNSGSSIAIGRYSGTGGFSNSIAFGRGVINSAAAQLNLANILYATGLYSSDTQRSAPMANGRIGISTSTPNQKLSIFASTTDAAIEFSTVSGPSEKWTLGVDISDGTKFKISSSSVLGTNDRFVIDGAGRVGIATSTPSRTLTVAGDLRLTGALYDSTNSAGTNGMVLRSTATGQRWVATSTLGLGTVTGSGSSNRVAYWSGASALTSNANFTYNGTNLNVGANNGYAIGGTRVFFASSSRFSVSVGDNTGDGYSSVAVGSGALAVVTSAAGYNVAVGEAALNSLTTGNENVAIGGNALGATANTSLNTAVGISALYGQNGWANVGLGYGAGDGGNSNFTSASSTYIGTESGYNIINGSDANSFLGYRSGYSVTSGARNILIGYQAADALTSGSNNIAIGYNIDFPSNTGSNQLNIGNLLFGTGIDGTGTSLSSGNIGIGTSTPSQKLSVAGDLRLTGALYDSVNSAGSNGYVLQSTATGQRWVATSTLGLGGSSFSNSAQLAALISDETGSGRLVFSGSPAFSGTATFSALTASSTLSLSGSSGQIQKLGSTAGQLDIDFPNATSTTQNIRLFRGTNTTGNRLFSIYKGDGTNTTVFQVTATSGALTINGQTSDDNLLRLRGISALGQRATMLFQNHAGTTTYGSISAHDQNDPAHLPTNHISIETTMADLTTTITRFGILWGVDQSEVQISNADLNLDSNSIFDIGNTTSFLSSTTWQMSGGNGTSGSSLLVANTTNSAVNAPAIIEARVGGNTSLGDPQLRLSMNGGNTWHVGVDNSDSDKFVIGTSTTVGAAGTSFLTITTAGVVNVAKNGGSFSLGDGSNVSAHMTVAGGRTMFGYNGANAVVQGGASKGILFNVNNGSFGSGNAAILTSGGNFGIATTTPANKLTVVGDARITGAFYDSANSAGTNGMVLKSTGTGFAWVATSTLGISGSGTIDGAGSSNRVAYWSDADTLTSDSAFTFANSKLTVPVFNASGASTTIFSINNAAFLRASSTNGLMLVGFGAGSSLLATTTAAGNTVYGYQALQTSTSSKYTTAIGYQALKNFAGKIGQSSGNTAIGYQSLFENTSGHSNTAIGQDTLRGAVGNWNVAVGNDALDVTSAGDANVALGVASVGGCNGGDVGSYNVGIGENALGCLNTAGSSGNVGIGRGAASGLQNGDALYNVAIGYYAGVQGSGAGDGNITIGYQAGDALSTGSNNILIGYDIDLQNNTWSNRLNIGNLLFGTGIDGTGTTLSSGNIGIGTSTPSAKLQIRNVGTGNAFVISSSSNSRLFTVDASGRVGIGADPEIWASLVTSGTIFSGTGFSLYNDGKYAVGDSTNYFSGSDVTDHLAFFTDSQERLRIVSGKIGIGTTTPNQKLSIFASTTDAAIEFSTLSGPTEKWTVGVDISDGTKFKISSSSALGTNDRFVIDGAGRVGIATSTPSRTLTIAGDLRLTGAIYDSLNSAGTNGMVLRSTATGQRWVATSTLGFASSFSNSSQLAALISDETGTNRAVFSASPAFSGTATFSALTASSTLTLSGQTASRALFLDASSRATTTAASSLLASSITNETGSGVLVFGTAPTLSSTTISGILKLSSQTASRALFVDAQSRATTTAASSLLSSSITDETGSGRLVFSGSPAFSGTATFSSLTATGTATFATTTQSGRLTLSGAAANIALGSNYLSGDGQDEGVFVTSAGNVGIGTTTSTARLAVLSTTEQLRLSYDASNYTTFTTSNAGNITVAPTGGIFTHSNTSAANDTLALSANQTGYAAQLRLNNLAAAAADGGNKIYFSGTSNQNQQAQIVSGWTTATTSHAYLAFGTRNSNTLAERMRLTAAGNLGIGTTTPSDKLEVVGGGIQIGNARYLSGRTAAGTSVLLIGMNGSSDTRVGQINNTIFHSGNVERARLTSTGSFGLGTSTPNQKLSIFASTTDAAIEFSTLSGPTEKWTVGVDISDGTKFKISSSSALGTNDRFVIDGAGNVGIGSSSPQSLLTLDKSTGLTGGVVAGLKEYFRFNNATLNAVNYGDNAQLVNIGTATTTLVGRMLRIQDSSQLGNTIRGLEVQAHRGTTTKGENTGISAFGRTFGLRGTTEGDAGGVFQPAGVFAQTRGTTQGNAIRGYSASITTEDLVSLFQDTSAFVGTGLVMNFGNSGGSFSSSTASKFVDFQNAGTSKFTVGNHGMTTIGDGTTNNSAGLQIGYGGICVDNDGTCTASTTGKITSMSSAVGHSDLAEMYFSSESLEPGEIVYSKGALSIGRADEDTKGLVLGVVSTNPGLTMGFDDKSLIGGQKGYPIALSGRVPIKLSTENGPIKTGDKITLSSIPGVGMKATEADTVVGTALEDFDGEYAYSEGFVIQFGDNVAQPDNTPDSVEDDKRINDGCYFGGGSELGAKPCKPRDVKRFSNIAQKTTDQSAAMRKALLDIADDEPEEATTPDGKEVMIGQALLFVNLSPFQTLAQTDILNELTSTSTDLVLGGDGEETLWSRVKTLAQGFVDGVLTVTGIRAENVYVENQLCVDGVCVTADDLRALLQQAHQPENGSGNDDDGGGGDQSEGGGGENPPPPEEPTGGEGSEEVPPEEVPAEEPQEEPEVVVEEEIEPVEESSGEVTEEPTV
jgi:hypothetical protein